MTILDRPHDHSTTAHRTPPRVLGLAAIGRAVVVGASAAAVSWLLVALLALVAWVATPGDVSWLGTVGAATVGWLVGHGATIRAGAVEVGLLPVGFTLLAVLAAVLATRWLDTDLDADRSPRLDLLGGVRAGTLGLLGGFVGGYLGFSLLSWLATAAMPVSVDPVSALVGTLGVALVGLGVGLRTHLSRATFAPAWHEQVHALVPLAVRRGLGLGLRLGPALIALGALPVVASLVWHAPRVVELTQDLAPGVVGGSVLGLVELAYLPTAALWGLSWLAGPGFSLGEGSSLTWTHVSTPPLPMIPAFGALPDTATMSPFVMLVGLLPVAAGVVLGVLALRRLSALTSLATKAIAVGSAWLATSLVAAALLLLSAGSLGTRSLSDIGPVLLAAPALAAELALGAALTLAWSWRRYHR
ncbi:DUF6350 family protein [Arsenicicoccus piscis]|uniref:Uncharacterized protein n=1 Tax=Arsenicicoccus piscis TaxID=673954 RepID=A0ABQ6HPT0_9MICO|nr:DUF6350 family protein [Arsenicicoccus piscis]MCH8628161.1 DUF6350 family protein [Arsenicicoccus piscis]GMA20458.1 hypothetical protein GCM10025862_24790 [Arsenicicoccus piscis]